MANSTTNHKNARKKELSEQRTQWRENNESLEKQKNELGYTNIQLKSFSNEAFIAQEVANTTQSKASAIIEIHNQLKSQKERYRLLWPEDYMVMELNKKHAVVHIDQTYILTEKENALGYKDFGLESPASFRAFYEDEAIRCSDGKMRSKAYIWLKKTTKPKRRKYTGITFDPTVTGHANNLYNIWKGFTRKPKQGSPIKYWAHVKDNICSGNEEHYQHIRKWLAYIFQHPDELTTALVLCGSQGVGKNSFVDPLGELLGPHYVSLSSLNELVSNFNYHLKHAVLIHANEALWGGHKKEMGAMKSMITDKTCIIEGKGKDRISVKNFRHIIMSSNENWPVHIDPDDRRFFVVRVSETHKEDHVYFGLIQNELDNGGYEGLLYDLLHEDISNFNPRQLPHSNESFSIKLRSADSDIRYIYEALNTGSFNIVSEGPTIWQSSLSLDDIYHYYRDWCNESEETAIKKNFFFATFKKRIPSVQKHRPSVDGSRKYMYQLPSLEQARADFCKAFKADPAHIFNSQKGINESL